MHIISLVSGWIFNFNFFNWTFLNCHLVLVDMCAGGQTVLTFSADRKKSARSSAGTAPQGIMGNR